jgi:hypothetical protein
MVLKLLIQATRIVKFSFDLERVNSVALHLIFILMVGLSRSTPRRKPNLGLQTEVFLGLFRQMLRKRFKIGHSFLIYHVTSDLQRRKITE